MYLPSGDQSVGVSHWSSWYKRFSLPVPSAVLMAIRDLLEFAGMLKYTMFLPSRDHTGVVLAPLVVRRVRRPLTVSKIQTSGLGSPYSRATLWPSGDKRGALLPRSPIVPSTLPLMSNQVSWPSSAEFAPAEYTNRPLLEAVEAARQIP